MAFGLPMTGLRQGTYEKTQRGLRISFPGETTPVTATIEADVLRLVEGPGKTVEYRYAGESAWYDLGAKP